MNSEELNVDSEWPAMPTETEIYILPDGRVVVADMPMELAEAMMLLGDVQPCEVQQVSEVQMSEVSVSEVQVDEVSQRAI
ncbi:MAG: hypothetical protein AAF639_22495 [Chloroflexota bacterium]